MAKNKNRAKPGQKGQHRLMPGTGQKKQPQPWYRDPLIPWAV